MNELIGNVLDLARVRLGAGLGLDVSADQPLLPALQQAIAELRIANPDRRIEVDLDFAEPIPADRGRLAQMLSNLLQNALTHGAADQPVRVGAHRTDDRFELWISNGGEPIPPKILSQLFEPFFRGQVQPSKQGLGLGLYIASEIARAHGGTLTVVSAPSETRFTFGMPVPDAAPRAALA
jgi:sigma-B regulation protein RsbU (phosphoserine phosphatase)